MRNTFSSLFSFVKMVLISQLQINKVLILLKTFNGHFKDYILLILKWNGSLRIPGYVCVCPSPVFGTVSLLFTAVFAGLSSWFHLPFPHRGVLGVQTHAPLCPAFSTHSADLNLSRSLMHHVLYPSRHLSSLVDHRIFELEQLRWLWGYGALYCYTAIKGTFV